MFRKPSWKIVGFVQLLTVVVALVGWRLTLASPEHRLAEAVPTPKTITLPREVPLVITPLYNDPQIVSEEDLAAVLTKILPRFDASQLKPNYVEHALRAWSIHATFADQEVMSGQALKEFLTDHGKYLASWGEKTKPLLEERSAGIGIRWGKENGASVHHDHWLASLTEAGTSLNEPIFTPTRRDLQLRDVLRQAMSDFRVDETEVEWSALGFGLWLPPVRAWTNNQGRVISFDLLAERLIRGYQRYGVCSGTHRVYSLMVLVRLDNDHHILSPAAREASLEHLRMVRDFIISSQFDDGHWPSNWSDGADAVAKPVADELYKQVIATGHHLEWLAIAPEELHPPREQIYKAAAWLVSTTKSLTQEDVLTKYTFFSHVGNALCLWRGTHPAEFWSKWEDKQTF